jgi:hypothetical protein
LCGCHSHKNGPEASAEAEQRTDPIHAFDSSTLLPEKQNEAQDKNKNEAGSKPEHRQQQ